MTALYWVVDCLATLVECIGCCKEVGDIPAASDIEAMRDEMKPWYDNYCFSEDALHTQSNQRRI